MPHVELEQSFKQGKRKTAQITLREIIYAYN